MGLAKALLCSSDKQAFQSRRPHVSTALPSQLNYVNLREIFTIRDEWMTQFDAISQIPFHVLLKKRKTLQKWSFAQHSVKMSIPCAAWVKDRVGQKYEHMDRSLPAPFRDMTTIVN